MFGEHLLSRHVHPAQWHAHLHAPRSLPGFEKLGQLDGVRLAAVMPARLKGACGE